ncbi:peptide-methionine (S)-S-oxide reductase MsrA [Candidatus Methylobacter oryzae]|uniref:Peptide methionine sulfoxide reductase MsrA n=1 Tax=Candidatus Methylobacter oryzae TaxID=2497749 RepID=A0ABY3C8C2_9GAMM|nr:peptide-methionine (S)-S-oxide reductase MsrA [Candidatus Methylobacter oryzae]TRW92838.1 peptide-methionine (S)-S-oxide reductase MsrA [Candidatus Methylobacter oryzae]
MIFSSKKLILPDPKDALPGRNTSMLVTNKHFVTGKPILPPFPEIMEQALFGMGCFWGAERKFWQCHGVFSTAVGYSGGYTPNPTYEEVCSGLTGHSEVVRVIYDPAVVLYRELLRIFWESHNPTQGMRQGNDIGTQYRSGIYTYTQQQFNEAIESKQHYQHQLVQSGFDQISTEIMPASEFYYAEDMHQQYLAKNPTGYCGLGGLDVPFCES